MTFGLLDLIGLGSAALSCLSAYWSWKAVRRLDRVRAELLLRSALHDLHSRMPATLSNTKADIRSKRSFDEGLAKLGAQSGELLAKVKSARKDHPEIGELEKALAQLVGLIAAASPDSVHTVVSKAAAIVELLGSAIRDYNGSINS